MENHCCSSLSSSLYQSLSFLLLQYKTNRKENKLNYSAVRGKKMPFSPESPLELPGCNREKKSLMLPLLLGGCCLSWSGRVGGMTSARCSRA